MTCRETVGFAPEELFEDPPVDELKAGWKTSEFWVAVAAKAAGLTAILFALWNKPTEGQQVGELVEKAVVAIGGLVVIGASAWAYIKGRSEVKSVAAAASAPLPKSAILEK